MPFKDKDIDSHIKGLKGHQREVWLSTANGVLSRCMEQGGTDKSCAPRSIRIANNAAKNAKVNSSFTLGGMLDVETIDKLLAMTGENGMALETETLEGIEVFSVGTWNGDKYDAADLDEMVKNFSALKGKVDPFLKLGHDDKQKLVASSELPAAGWISSLKRSGSKLLADISGVPKKLAEIIKAGGYRKRSSEILWDWKEPASGKTYKRVFKALALLGAEMPAVTTLDDIYDQWYEQEGAQDRIAAWAYDGESEPVHVYEMDEEEKEESAQTYNFIQKEKSKVKYRAAADGAEARCGACKFLNRPHQFPDDPPELGERGVFFSCSLVEGSIEANQTCQLFETAPDGVRLFEGVESNGTRDSASTDTHSAPSEEGDVMDKEQLEKYQADLEAERKARAEAEEAKAEEAKRYAEKEAENKALQERLDRIERENNEAEVKRFVDSVCAETNMRIQPKQKALVTYLLTEAPDGDVKKYAEGKDEMSYGEALTKFIEGLPDLSKVLFKEYSRITEEGDEETGPAYDPSDPKGSGDEMFRQFAAQTVKK